MTKKGRSDDKVVFTFWAKNVDVQETCLFMTFSEMIVESLTNVVDRLVGRYWVWLMHCVTAMGKCRGKMFRRGWLHVISVTITTGVSLSLMPDAFHCRRCINLSGVCTPLFRRIRYVGLSLFLWGCGRGSGSIKGKVELCEWSRNA